MNDMNDMIESVCLFIIWIKQTPKPCKTEKKKYKKKTKKKQQNIYPTIK